MVSEGNVIELNIESWVEKTCQLVGNGTENSIENVALRYGPLHERIQARLTLADWDCVRARPVDNSNTDGQPVFHEGTFVKTSIPSNVAGSTVQLTAPVNIDEIRVDDSLADPSLALVEITEIDGKTADGRVEFIRPYGEYKTDGWSFGPLTGERITEDADFTAVGDNPSKTAYGNTGSDTLDSKNSLLNDHL